MKKNDKLKAYEFKDHEDSDICLAIIATNLKEAKKIGWYAWCTEFGQDEDYIDCRCKLMRNEGINIKGLKIGAVLDIKEGMRRGLYSGGEGLECDICHNETTITCVVRKKLCICSDCEEKIDEGKIILCSHCDVPMVEKKEIVSIDIPNTYSKFDKFVIEVAKLIKSSDLSNSEVIGALEMVKIDFMFNNKEPSIKLDNKFGVPNEK